MGPGSLLKECWEFVPILVLLSVGGLIVLQSGVHRWSSDHGGRQLVRNLTQLVLRVMGYVGALLALQYLVGLRPALGW
jgi:hypothetical protein